VLAVVLALLSAALFGAMTVALRYGFREGRAPDAELGAFVCTAAAALIAAVAAVVDRESTQLTLRDAAFFALAGLIAPGASQLFSRVRCATRALRARPSLSGPPRSSPRRWRSSFSTSRSRRRS
jgi:hypothetical protein